VNEENDHEDFPIGTSRSFGAGWCRRFCKGRRPGLSWLYARRTILLAERWALRANEVMAKGNALASLAPFAVNGSCAAADGKQRGIVAGNPVGGRRRRDPLTQEAGAVDGVKARAA
jgi:hypothetical protein